MKFALNVHRTQGQCAAPSPLSQLDLASDSSGPGPIHAHHAGFLCTLKRIILYHFSIIFLAGSLTLLLSSCGGGGATFQSTGNKTLGQELEDLQASYDKGIITQKQYEDIKKKLIKKYTN